MIKVTEYRKTAQKFKRYFDLNLNEFTDPLLTSEHEFGFDYEKFEQAMRARHSETDDNDWSIQNVVEKFYGGKAVDLIINLL